MKAALIVLFGTLAALASTAWADSYETPVPAPPPRAAAPLPPMPGPAQPNMARVYVYRDNGDYQNLEWTKVWFNGAYVGDSGPGTYFYRDVRPGTYTITLWAEEPDPDRFATVTVAPGSTTYVKVWARYDYALKVPAVHTRHMQFNGIDTQPAPNVFTDAMVPALFAVPEISHLEPHG